MIFEGVVRNVVFENKINNYRVISLDTDDGEILCVGTIESVIAGENIRIEGDLTYHNKYGEQVIIHEMKRLEGPTTVAIENYLSSGIIPNIGKATAKKIVEQFGKETLEILKNTPSRLLEIEGIGPKKFKEMKTVLEEQKEIQENLFYLQSLGLSINQAQRILGRYEGKAKERIEENPYVLIDDIRGIGFRIADNIAQKTDIKPDSEFRIKAGFIYLLQHEANQQGHTCLPYDEAMEKVSKLLSLSREKLEDHIMDFYMERSLIISKIEDQAFIYLPRYYDSEIYVASRIAKILNEENENYFNVERELEKLSEKEWIFSEGQLEAVKLSLTENILIITGGPGTGKTTIIRNICEIYQRKGLKILLAAPTGRAAKRLTEFTEVEAVTIHRLLGYMPSDEYHMLFSKNEDEPLEADLLIIDEASMIDLALMENLLRAIHHDTRVIFVGDADQLPSVGAGNVLEDMIHSKRIKTVKLDKIFRQEKESNIIINAHKINHGEFPILNQKDKDFFFIDEKDPAATRQEIMNLCASRLPKYYNIESIDQIQILTPVKKSEIGTVLLNKALQEVLNPKTPDKEELVRTEVTYREKDKVMQIKNNYQKKFRTIYGQEGEGVFNGDYGKIEKIDPVDQSLTVLFDEERCVEYTKKEFDQLTLAYAITIHKSQGSEFPVVVIPIGQGPYMLMTRNLIYTAITRAKKLVVLVGERKYLKKMINNNFIVRRYTNLKDRISEYIEKIGMLYGDTETTLDK